jgi:hypothetical protein
MSNEGAKRAASLAPVLPRRAVEPVMKPLWIVRTLVGVALIGLGCGNDSSPSDEVDGGGEPDAVAAADAAQVPDQLVGVWGDCEDDSARFTFGADGAFAFDEDGGEGSAGEHLTGTFTADAQNVVAEAVDADDIAVRYELTYHVSGDRLALGAYLPVDDHAGAVGTWMSRLQVEPEGSEPFGGEQEMTLREDLSATLVERPLGEAEVVREGTWGEDPEAGDLAFTYVIDDGETPITIHLHFELLDDAALGKLRFCRH